MENEIKPLTLENIGVFHGDARDALHGTFVKAAGELLTFTLTNHNCTQDFTSGLNKVQKKSCEQALKAAYKMKHAS